VTLLDDTCDCGRADPCLHYVIPEWEQFFYHTDLGNTQYRICIEIVTLWSDKVYYSIEHNFNLMEFIKNVTFKLKPSSFEGYVQNFRLWHWPFLLKEPRKAFMLGFEHNGGQEREMKNKRPPWCHLLFYFTSYVLNMFRILIYPSSGACDYSVELPHWSDCSWFDVCWSFGVVGLEWYPCCWPMW